jgi:Bacterial Ig-like domain (group 2)
MRRAQVTTLAFVPFSALTLAFVMATSLTACSDEGSVTVPPPPPPPPPPAVSLAIFPLSRTLHVGDTAFFSYEARDSASRVVTTLVEWTSDNPGVATVDRTVGRITAIAAGSATITVAAGALRASAVVTVRLPVPTTIQLSSSSVILAVGYAERLTAQVYDEDGRFMSTSVSWSSQNPSVASVNGDGTVTGTGTGSTVVVATSGSARAEASVRVEPADFLMQWASHATASSQYEPVSWAPAQATGAPNVYTCNDESRAWASAGPGVDWLELTYDEPVRPVEIRIFEVWAPGSIVTVEVKDMSGNYHQVYSASPQPFGNCLRTLVIPVTGVTEFISTVRVSVDQRQLQDWTEIDAVRLSGFRRP